MVSSWSDVQCPSAVSLVAPSWRQDRQECDGAVRGVRGSGSYKIARVVRGGLRRKVALRWGRHDDCASYKTRRGQMGCCRLQLAEAVVGGSVRWQRRMLRTGTEARRFAGAQEVARRGRKAEFAAMHRREGQAGKKKRKKRRARAGADRECAKMGVCSVDRCADGRRGRQKRHTKNRKKVK